MYITGGDKTPKRCLQLKKGNRIFHQVAQLDMKHDRTSHAVCAYAERFVFASGSGYDFKQATTVECFDTET